MTSFFSFALKKKIPSWQSVIEELKRRTLLSVLFYIVLVGLLLSLYLLFWRISLSFTVAIPKQGGTLSEGVIGAPRFINPLLATTSTDTELVSMIYSGLSKRNTAGEIVSDLATYTVSPDGLTYTFTLLPNTKFSDGSPLTSEDVAFTYGLIQKGFGGGGLRTTWDGIQVATRDARTIIFTLPAPSDTFPLLTTVGIFPKKLWNDVTLETFTDAPANLSPIGSGSFALRRIKTENDVPHVLILTKNTHALLKPYIDTYKITVYPNQDSLVSALSGQKIDLTSALDPQQLTEHVFSGYTIQSIPTDDTFVIAALGTNTIFSDSDLRSYINTVIDKTALLATIQGGYGLLQDQIDSFSDEDPIETAKLALLSHKQYTVTTTGALLRQGAPIHVLLVVESNSKEALAANFIAAKLLAAGINAEVRSFDSGTYRDLVAHASAPAIITVKNRPADLYTIELPLYTRTAPIIINKSMSDLLSTSGTPTFSNLYTTTATWFTQTKHLYRWFKK